MDYRGGEFFALILTHTCWKEVERKELLILGIAISFQASFNPLCTCLCSTDGPDMQRWLIQNPGASSPLSPTERFSDWGLTPAYISLLCAVHWHDKVISPHSKGIMLAVSPGFLPDFTNKGGELPLYAPLETVLGKIMVKQIALWWFRSLSWWNLNAGHSNPLPIHHHSSKDI